MGNLISYKEFAYCGIMATVEYNLKKLYGYVKYALENEPGDLGSSSYWTLWDDCMYRKLAGDAYPALDMREMVRARCLAVVKGHKLPHDMKYLIWVFWDNDNLRKFNWETTTDVFEVQEDDVLDAYVADDVMSLFEQDMEDTVYRWIEEWHLEKEFL